VLFALCVVATLLCEGIAEASHGDHLHDGDNCPVCMVDQQLKNPSRQFKIPCPSLAFPLGGGLLSAFIQKQFFCYSLASSVKLKIKMNT
jgi:hypothetical protein